MADTFQQDLWDRLRTFDFDEAGQLLDVAIDLRGKPLVARRTRWIRSGICI